MAMVPSYVILVALVAGMCIGAFAGSMAMRAHLRKVYQKVIDEMQKRNEETQAKLLKLGEVISNMLLDQKGDA